MNRRCQLQAFITYSKYINLTIWYYQYIRLNLFHYRHIVEVHTYMYTWGWDKIWNQKKIYWTQWQYSWNLAGDYNGVECIWFTIFIHNTLSQKPKTPSNLLIYVGFPVYVSRCWVFLEFRKRTYTGFNVKIKTRNNLLLLLERLNSFTTNFLQNFVWIEPI